jgi:cation:H+ antiporter
MGADTIASLAGGLVLLVAGAELMVRGASRLAVTFGVSPLVIGLTVVAFGTSSPELAVSLQASLNGRADIALGNVIGSNIFNVLFILGLSAAVAPLLVSQHLVRLDVPIMVLASLVLWLMALDGLVGRVDGVILFTGLIVYTLFLIRQSRRETAAIRAEYDAAFGARGRLRTTFLDSVLVTTGLVLLVLGSRLLVDGAVELAVAFGVSQLVIGLTIVAIGTSLPELATSLIATVRGERDIAVGNIVGSNIFNILSILGITAVVSGGVPAPSAVIGFDLPVMAAVAVACLPIFFSGSMITRWEGIIFLIYYVTWSLYVVLLATQHDALPVYGRVMVMFVLPLTTLTLGMLVWRGVRRRPSSRG